MIGEKEITGRVVVCVLETDPSPFHDNRIGTCHFCARRVQHRPHVPTPSTLVCRICWAERVEPGDGVEVTARSVREYLNFIRRN